MGGVGAFRPPPPNGARVNAREVTQSVMVIRALV